MRARTGVLWVILGLTLGLGAAAFLGVLVFWGLPSLQRAQSPFTEARSGQITVRCLKESPIAPDRTTLAEEAGATWQATLATLGIAQEEIPWTVYVYLYAEPGELPAAFAGREAEEGTPVAVVDHLHGRPLAGALARLACSLAYGGPGNKVFPRGLALYLDDPARKWAAEAVAYSTAQTWKLLFQHPERLLPRDPWEDFFFKVDAPWVSALPSLETVRTLLVASTTEARAAPGWEALAAAFAGFVLSRYGEAGAKAFWLASTWESGAQAISLSPAEFAAQWQGHLDEATSVAEADPVIAAKRALYLGKPSQALEHLARLEGADMLRAQAYLALGQPAEAVPLLPGKAGCLTALAQVPPLDCGRLRLVAEGKGWDGKLSQADAALARAISFWRMPEDALPEKIVIYVCDAAPPVDLPWGVIWTFPAQADLVGLAVRFVLEASSPLGIPKFDALTQGLTLLLAHPERDFRQEAAAVLREGRWVPLSQPLFDAYPREVAEAEAGAVAAYLVEVYGDGQVRALWEAMLGGLSPYGAILQTLGISLDELDRDVRAWVGG